MKIRYQSNIVHAGMQETITVIRDSVDEVVSVKVLESDYIHFKLLPIFNWIKDDNGFLIGEVPFKKDSHICLLFFDAGYIKSENVYVPICFESGEQKAKVDFRIFETMLDIEATEKSLDFGKMMIGQSLKHDIEIKNIGEHAVEIIRFYCNISNSIEFEPFKPFKILPGKSVTKPTNLNIKSNVNNGECALCIHYKVDGVEITTRLKINAEIDGYDNSGLPFDISVLPIRINNVSKTSVKKLDNLVSDCIKIGQIFDGDKILVPVKINSVSDDKIIVSGINISGTDTIDVVKKTVEINGFDSRTIDFMFIPMKTDGINAVKISFSVSCGEKITDCVFEVIWGVSEN